MDDSELADYRDMRPSGDQEQYMYLDLPDEGSIQVPYYTADYTDSETLNDGFEIHHVYVDCAEIQEVGFPLEANPREPAKTRQVKAMRRTLQKDSNEFVKKNNGVVVISSDIVENDDDNGVTFEFGSDEGICNGGHTYFAIQTAGDIPEKQQLHLEVLEIPESLDRERKDIITDIAKARNNSNELEDRSEADFMGYYDPFRDKLQRPELIRWRENDSDANIDANPIDAVHFLRLLICLDVTRFGHPVYNPDGQTHKSLATSRSKFHSTWMNKVEKAEDDSSIARPLRYLLPMVNEVMYIRDILSYTFLQREENDISLGSFRITNLYKDYITNTGKRPLFMDEFIPAEGIDLRNPLEVMFMGLFRSNLYCSPNPAESPPEYVGWLTDPEELWFEQATTVLEPMADLFSDLGDDPKQFIRISSPFNNSLYRFGMDKQIRRPPAVLYHVDSGARYEKVEDRKEAEYWLEKGESGMGDIEIQPLASEVPENAAVYSASMQWQGE
jgi:hypothetical protein